jgi:hypothetical protein
MDDKYYGVRKYKHRYDWLKARFDGEQLYEQQRKLSDELARNEEIYRATERISFWTQTDKTRVLEMILDAYKKYDNDDYGTSIKTKVKHAAEDVQSQISRMLRNKHTDAITWRKVTDKELEQSRDEHILAQYSSWLSDDELSDMQDKYILEQGELSDEQQAMLEEYERSQLQDVDIHLV